MTKGLLTAEKTYLINTPTEFLWAVHYYDDFGMDIRTFRQHYLGGSSALNLNNYDDLTTSYTFTKQINSVTRRHYFKNSGGTATLALTALDAYTYDQIDRKKNYSQTITVNGVAQPKVMLLSQTYNEIGQMIKRGLHSAVSPYTSFLQNVDYRYNPRGWLSSINNSDLSNDQGVTNADTTDLFGMNILYNEATTVTPQYNSNISTIRSKSGKYGSVTPTNLNFDYAYDRLNRLTNSFSYSSSKSASTAYYNENLSYDEIGNIKTLGRYEFYNGQPQQIDSLAYSYTGNQLTRVDDNSTFTGSYGFLEAQKAPNEYTYNGNGYLSKDLNKGISNITYNELNLPEVITINGKTVTYTYDSDGNKLKKVYLDGVNTTTTEYVSGIQYTNGVIDFLQTEIGRTRKSGNNYIYEYDLQDHLGNTRVTIKQDAITSKPIVLQEDDYYSFGSTIKSREYIVFPKNEYLFNKKEYQEETGFYDYGARFYDPLIARWNGVDELADKFNDLSPYSYTADNPLNLLDPDGKDIVSVGRDVYFDNKNNPDATNFFKILKGTAKSLYIDIERRPEFRNSINDQEKRDYYSERWVVFSTASLKTAAAAVAVIPNKSLDNLVLETHGGEKKGEDDIMTADVTPDDKNYNKRSNYLTTSEIRTFAKTGKGSSNAAALSLLGSKVADKGRFIFAACNVVRKTGLGNDFGKAVSALTGNRLNIFLPTSLISTPDYMTVENGKGKPDTDPALGMHYTNSFFVVSAEVGWLQIKPSGKTNSIRAIILNPFPDPKLPPVIVKPVEDKKKH